VEILWFYADVSLVSFDIKKQEKIKTCNTVGKKSCKPGSGGSHIKAPWKYKNRI
jgi:hypothetical protein